MSEKFIRTRRLLGDTAMDKLKNARVAVFGVGGVGGYVVEALVRSGIGEIDMFDNDTVAESNINRQIIATTETIGRLKVDVAKERALLINPDIKVNSHNCFYMPDNADNYNLAEYSYIVDAIDTVTAKIELIKRAKALDVPIISSMGTGNKLDASMLEVTDIKKTEMCPLARTMRRELKNRGITSLKVVYSKEKPIVPDDGERTPASVAFVPAAAGLIIAGEVVKDLVKNSQN
ncbi:MAG: tRNA threonylcarbamoyladenosine dehydratase [Clostridia bacterium]|nr:tRNA threonylcarbamoyladenosine dehydratase [Clostridia bacterium]